MIVSNQDKRFALTRGGFRRNLLWNLAATTAPVIAALLSIPALVGAMGVERFGVLSLAWVIAGYFSFFDMGLGKAITQVVAQRLAKKEQPQIPGLVWTGMGLMTVLGLAGCVFLWLVTPLVVGHGLKIPMSLFDETIGAFNVLAVSIPFVITTTGLRGLLEAYQRFDLVAFLRIPLGVLTYVAPLIALWFSSSLHVIVAALVATRIAGCIGHAIVCLKLFPELRRPQSIQKESARTLLAFGGWMTVSNVVGPLLLYLGRFVLALVVSAEAVAYFSTPYDVIVYLLLFPSLYINVLFPVLVRSFHEHPESLRALYRKGLWHTALVMLPLSTLAFLVAKPGLAWWIGAEFSRAAYLVAQWLAIGVFVNSFGHLSQAVIQASGRPDLTAKVHICELVLYVPYLWALVAMHGVEGAAIAWVVRVTLSTIVLHGLAEYCIRRHCNVTGVHA